MVIDAEDSLLWMLFVGFVNEGHGLQPAYAFVRECATRTGGFRPRCTSARCVRPE
jgi:hypothetical protein